MLILALISWLFWRSSRVSISRFDYYVDREPELFLDPYPDRWFFDSFAGAGERINVRAPDKGSGWSLARGILEVHEEGARFALRTLEMDDAVALTYELPSNNYRLNCRVYPDRGTQELGGRSGVIVRAVDANNFWFVRWRQDTGALEMISCIDGVTTVEASEPLSGPSLPSWYDLEVVCRDELIAASVNGVTASFATATHQDARRCGLRGVAGTEAGFAKWAEFSVAPL